MSHMMSHSLGQKQNKEKYAVIREVFGFIFVEI